MNLSQNNVFTMDPIALADALEVEMFIAIPPSCETPEEMRKMGKLLGLSIQRYSYLSNLAIMARLKKRALKQAGADKLEIDNALAREEVLSQMAENLKMTYNAISRIISVKQEINKELSMTDCRRDPSTKRSGCPDA